MYSVQSISIHYVLYIYIVHCTMYITQYCNPYCTIHMDIVYYALHYTAYIIHCTAYTVVHCTMYMLLILLYIVQCTLWNSSSYSLSSVQYITRYLYPPRGTGCTLVHRRRPHRLRPQHAHALYTTRHAHISKPIHISVLGYSEMTPPTFSI